jgi:prepilin-type N-terminal cleavage/methylation domain-containing protein
MKHPGFTLAELLIALAILGVIATFTIPKVLHSQEDSKRRAIFKETIASIEAITRQGWIEGALTTSQSGSYLLQHLNAYKLCSTNADSEGCWQHAMPAPEETEPGAILPNGVTLGGFSDNPSTDNWIFIDWNGAALPNTEGDDQLRLLICYAPEGCGASSEVKPGTARIVDGYWASLDLYDEIFSQ